MGSFIVQCFASKQVVSEREPCRVALLRQASTYEPSQVTFYDTTRTVFGVESGGVGMDALWHPVSGFLKAEYVDYGRFKLHDTPENRRFLVAAFDHLWTYHVQVQAGKPEALKTVFDFRALVKEKAPTLFAAMSTKAHALNSTPASAFVTEEAEQLWDALQEAMREGQAFDVSTSNRALLPLGLAVVHESAFEELIALSEGLTSYRGLRLDRTSVVTRMFEGLDDELKDMPPEYKAYARQDRIRSTLRMSLEHGVEHNVLWPMRRALEQAADKVLNQGAPISAFLTDCKELLDQVLALKGLDYLNLAFTPVAYAGQDYDNTCGTQYAKFVAKTSEKVSESLRKRYE